MQNEGPPIVAKTLRRAADAYACACDDQPLKLEINRGCCPIRETAATDVSCTTRGVWYVIPSKKLTGTPGAGAAGAGAGQVLR